MTEEVVPTDLVVRQAHLLSNVAVETRVEMIKL